MVRTVGKEVDKEVRNSNESNINFLKGNIVSGHLLVDLKDLIGIMNRFSKFADEFQQSRQWIIYYRTTERMCFIPS